MKQISELCNHCDRNGLVSQHNQHCADKFRIGPILSLTSTILDWALRRTFVSFRCCNGLFTELRIDMFQRTTQQYKCEKQQRRDYLNSCDDATCNMGNIFHIIQITSQIGLKSISLSRILHLPHKWMLHFTVNLVAINFPKWRGDLKN